MNDMIKNGMWKQATDQWGVVQDVLEMQSNGVNFYNMLNWGAGEPGVLKSDLKGK